MKAIEGPTIIDVVEAERVGGDTTIRVGIATLVVAVGGFGLWAGLAPLDAAAVARGEVKVENYRKTVQHMEGGIVRSIEVRDGDVVVQGQPLMFLDDTAIRARHEQLLSQYWDSLAAKARLAAERDGTPDIDFTHWLPQTDHPRLHEVTRAQTNLFQARKATLDGQVAVLRKRLVLYDREADALLAEQTSKDRQLILVREEVATTAALVKKGLGLRPRLLALQRDAERLRGERDDYSARIARLRQAQASTELEIANVAYQHLNDVAAELRDVEGSIRDVEQQLTAVADSLKRTVVRSPQAGVVVALKVHTRGAVLQPGEEVMDIVPRNETLVVEAKVPPEDIDRVIPGRQAQIRFRTFLRGLTPPASGEVTQVSADLFHEERTGQPYYLARIAFDPESLKKLPGPLTPGMQTDVLITTGERTALEYLLMPLTQRMALAMREK